MIHGPRKPVCSRCGCEDLLADATVHWDPARQCWIIENTFTDTVYCVACEENFTIEWI